MSDIEEIPVHFQDRGKVFRGAARFEAGWHHIKILGRRVQPNGWDYALATREMGDDKFEISREQFESLSRGQEIQIDFGSGLTTVTPGEYAPKSDDREQGTLFDS